MSTLTIRILSRSDRLLATLTLPASATLSDLKAAFYKQSPKHSPDRQYYTLGKDADRVVVTQDKPLSSLPSPAVLYFKDLGPQIGWQTVFHVEYAGPIIMHALCYLLPQVVYPHSKHVAHTHTQTVAFYLVALHYIKREFETAFVHRFSNGTMPLLNIFKNSAHYWIIGGIAIAYFLYHPQYTEPPFPPLLVNIFAALFILFEFGNLYSHIILMNLRPPGTRVRAVPQGFLFRYVSCANYTFELAAWLVFAIMTQTLTAYIFLIVSTAQIVQWSAKKHYALKKEFGKDGIKPYALIPFIW